MAGAPHTKAFFADCEHWLAPYAHYCYLRDFYGTCVFSEWPDHKQWNEADRKALSNPKSELYNKVAFYYYMQFVLDQQMRSAHEYARARGVILKGDIPIGVNRNGCDVWHEPEYFHLDSQAGAPPDAFSVNGQNWGLPTYNWDRMIADGCEWWVRRFQNMAKYFDAYRIDHVLGFFRIWAIPTDCVGGLLGQFQPALAMSRDEIQSYGLNFQEHLFTTPEGLVSAKTCKGVKFLDPREKAKEMSEFLKKKKKCDLVILISHLGWGDTKYEDPSIIANSRYIDLVLGGHSHSYFQTLKYAKNLDGKDIPVDQNGKNAAFIGKMTLTVEK